jgi:hypothetical protein
MFDAPFVNGGLVSKLLSPDEVVKGRHFDAEIIVLCVRWYVSSPVATADAVEEWDAGL